MQGEMIRSETPVPTPRRAQLTAGLLKEEREQHQVLAQYVKQCMIEGTDYGRIAGSEKPTLLKPGAEKLIDLFGCTPEFTLVPEFCHEDFESGFFKYTFRCRIISREQGKVLAEGYGSANSRESRFRWRVANRKCPVCNKDAIIQGKSEYGGGWVCFKKKGGCGEKYASTDERITSQSVGRVENEDIADLDNTILKMAKKRAQVDGAIALARCSDMFTQDVEDFMLQDLGSTSGAPAPVSTPSGEAAGGHEPLPPLMAGEKALSYEVGASKAEGAPVPLTWGEASTLARGIAGARDARSLRKVGMSIKEARAGGRISEQERSDLEKLYRAKQLELTNSSRPSIRRAS
ncbi:hypothetical protein [Hyalangium versicolor]|uniref:hypothetical protein n=1 Tax=Hyalangium versicolor TaxID=2861190 RepID=UPI001CCC86DA|nr:hypothetical protein [Hyalangium versicolor]